MRDREWLEGKGDPVSLGTSMCGGYLFCCHLDSTHCPIHQGQNTPFSLKKLGDHRSMSL